MGATPTEHITTVENGAKPPRRRVDVRRGCWGAQNHLTGSVSRDFGALGDLLQVPLVASRCPRDRWSLKMSKALLDFEISTDRFGLSKKLELSDQVFEHLSLLITQHRGHLIYEAY